VPPENAPDEIDATKELLRKNWSRGSGEIRQHKEEMLKSAENTLILYQMTS